MHTTSSSSIEQYIYDFPTTYKQGFIEDDLRQLARQFRTLNIDELYSTLNENVIGFNDDGHRIYYRIDVMNAVTGMVSDSTL